MIIALSGGVGGARMCAGLSQVYCPEQLSIVVNVGDDFDHWGLRICPDLDTVMYTLSGRVNETAGWGLADESWSTIDRVSALGGEDWFRLGDKDLATHLVRTQRLQGGALLSAATEALCRSMGVRHPVIPVTDDDHRSVIMTEFGLMAFQEYFVKRRCEPQMRGIQFLDGAQGRANPSLPMHELINSNQVDGLIICPSNPVLSILPILEVSGLREWLTNRKFPVIAVSPFIAGQAVKGPAAKVFNELGMEASLGGLAHWYGDLVDCWLVDDKDAHNAARSVKQGQEVRHCDILLNTSSRRRQVAEVLKQWLRELVGSAA